MAGTNKGSGVTAGYEHRKRLKPRSDSREGKWLPQEPPALRENVFCPSVV